jgi:hypothetical protein
MGIFYYYATKWTPPLVMGTPYPAYLGKALYVYYRQSQSKYWYCSNSYIHTFWPEGGL